MKIIRLFFGILTAMLVLTVTVEGIEFLIVKIVSGQSVEYLSSHQLEYFTIRNRAWILVLKVVYTFFAAFSAGWLGSRITKQLQLSFLTTIAVIQGLSFSYAMFFSEFKNSLPTYYWFLLLIAVLSGVYIGQNINKKIINQK